jgi:signal transduction histidine kinase
MTVPPTDAPGATNAAHPESATEWLATVERVMARMAATPPQGTKVGALAEGVVAGFDAAWVRIWLYDPLDNALHLRASAGLPDPPYGARSRIPSGEPGSPVIAALLRRESVVLDAIRPESGLRHAEWLTSQGVRSYAGFPLVVEDRFVGVMAVMMRTPWSPPLLAALRVLTRHAALELDHSRLLGNAGRYIERLTALGQIARQLLAADELETVLRVVVDAGARLCSAGGAMVSLIDPERRWLRPAAFTGAMERVFADHTTAGRALDDAYLAWSPTGQALTRGKLVVVEDYAAWPHAIEARDRTVAAGVRAFIAAPLRVGGESIGMLWVTDPAPRPFAPEDVAMVEALADQAALAIEHARLVERSQDAAVLEERTRLARDLHDSVTQSLFSLNLLARAAQTQHERDRPELGGTLARVGAIAREALIEMRLLLFELRPPALGEEGLCTALATFTDAFQARTEVPITCVVEADVRLGREAEAAIFRIAQEALANAARHAHATQVTVRVAEEGGHLVVSVADDGVGFDSALLETPAAERPGGMGLQSMHERAAAAGIDLAVESAPGTGTRVRVVAPIPSSRGAGPLR